MKFPFASLLALPALFCLLTAPAAHAEDKQLTKADVEAIVKQVIKDNPQFVIQSLMDYQDKERLQHLSAAALNLTHMQDKIAHDPRAPFVGNPKGDVTVTEFFDYHCSYCKRFYPEVGKLLQEDKNVKIVFKELPIIAEDSELASRAALAVYSIDKSKYFDYHILLMQTNAEFTPELLAEKAARLGIDPEAFKKAYNDPEIAKDIQNNKQLASSLDIQGTPAAVVGTQLVPGAVSYNKLLQKVEEARNAAGNADSAVKTP